MQDDPENDNSDPENDNSDPENDNSDPENDNRVDQEKRDRIEEIRAQSATSIRKLSHTTTILLSFLVIVQLGLGVWSVVLTKQQGHANDKIANQQDAITRQTAAIQQQRKDAARSTCKDQNVRHAKTVVQLTKELAIALLQQAENDPKATPAQQEDAKREGRRVAQLEPSDSAGINDAYRNARRRVPEPLSQQIDNQRDFTILLIDALAPIQNCDKRVKAITNGGA